MTSNRGFGQERRTFAVRASSTRQSGGRGLPIAASRRGSTVATREMPAATCFRKTSASLSWASTESQTKGRGSAVVHCAAKVVFPHPAGATTLTTRAPLRRSVFTSAGRATTPGRTAGGRSFACSTSSAEPAQPLGARPRFAAALRSLREVCRARRPFSTGMSGPPRATVQTGARSRAVFRRC